ncbi:hypothetical protein K8089_15080 [Aequorivita sp. F47161]|uniref:Uncharacterized protein n=1 Tax=Aequorivita vitellina TaxID=2874475 RepID=A0A9X1U4I5_9FLAO|nr:hypothetical protein [Aequorivita vitellina]MCG2420347.1 hypothetical protein [Aequorivita vitellina]
MSEQKDDFSKGVESLFRKTVEVNKHYLKQSTELFKEFGNSGKELKNFNLFQPEVLMGAFTSFTKMNLDHYKNMMDLGFAITKKAFNPASEDAAGETEESAEEPSFVLSATTFAGNRVNLQFLLDNIKSEEATCQLINSDYLNEEVPANTQKFPTVFNPQSFTLAAGQSQTVTIQISVNNDVRLGIYQSKVQVLGFEPAYFLIKLTIAEKPVEKPAKKSTAKSAKKSIAKTIKTTGNGRQKTKRTKKE